MTLHGAIPMWTSQSPDSSMGRDPHGRVKPRPAGIRLPSAHLLLAQRSRGGSGREDTSRGADDEPGFWAVGGGGNPVGEDSGGAPMGGRSPVDPESVGGKRLMAV